MDLFEKCRSDEGYFGELREASDRYLTRPILDPYPGNRMVFQGKEQIMWSVNNYLGLAGNDEIRAEAVEAAKEYSVSAPMGARMMSGNTADHINLESSLATFAEKEDAILFNYGYLGVLGTVNSLVDKDDIVVIDKLAHACIVDSATGNQGQFRVFKHNDMNSLEFVLKRINRERKGGVLIVTEGTYGMTGDLAKLPEICDLKEKYEARLYIDDAHGIGVLGEQGRGTADHFGVQDRIDIYFGTFAKAFASIGGFSASSHEVVEWIKYNARTQVFAKSLPMIYVKSLQKTLQLVIDGDERRKVLWENSDRLKEGLRDLGYYIGPGECPICPVFVPLREGDVLEVGGSMVRYFRDAGIFVSAVVYPVIPLGLCMFRMIPTAAHTEEDIDSTIAVFKRMRDEKNLDLSITGADRRKVAKVYGEAVEVM